MKKFLSFAMAAVLLMVGCAKDNDSLNVDDQTVAVTFSANLPAAVSRATVGDGSQADVLYYAIYDTEGNLFADYPYPTDAIAVENNKATVTLDLVKGQTYKIAFWAQDADAPYTFNRTAGTITATYDNNELSNDEMYDAFYACEQIEVTGPAIEPITLFRPFAQINLGASKDDVEKAKALGVEIDASKVTLTGVYQTLNLYDGKASNPTTATVVFDYNELPGNDLNVKGTDYEYIAANYILANAETDVTELTFSVKDGSEPINEDVAIPAVSYKRNYRTNILGRLLTSSVDFNIVIDGTPTGDLELSKEAELILAMQTEGEYTLTEDLTLSKPFVVEEGVNFTLNLNGKKLSGESARSGGVVVNNGALTVKGGTIASTTTNGGSAILNKGSLTIEDATIEGAPSDTATGTAAYAVNSQGENSKLVVNNSSISGRGAIGATNGTKVVINSGTFHTPAVAWGHAVYANDEGTEVVINGGTFSEGYAADATNWGMYQIAAINKAKVIVNGGNFEPWDCANNKDLHTANEGVIEIYGGTFAEDPSNQGGVDYVADGYKAIKSGDKWAVMPESVNEESVVADAAGLANAIVSSGEAILVDDVTYAAPINSDANINLNGNTFEATGTINLSNNADLTMVGGDYEVNGTYGHVDVRPTTAEGSVVTYKDVNFSFNQLNKTYGPSTNRLGTVVEVCPTAVNANVKILFEGCTFDNAQVLFEGLSGTVGTFEAEFKNCTFNSLTSSAPIYVQNYIKGSIKVTGCTFNLTCTSSSASALSISQSSSTEVTITAENNTLNAVAATPYTFDASKGETEVHNVKVNGTPANIKFISSYANTTVTETGTVKSGIAL